MSALAQPLQLGACTLKNRIIMSPLTRSRSDNPGRVPNALNVDYYRQRASAGLILTEATAVTPMGVGYAHTPGIWTAEQVEGWKAVTKAVHDQGGCIFMQLWHVGRISHPMFLGGELPVSASAVRPEGHVSLVRPETAYITPREMTLTEISNLASIYRTAAEHAKEAGFDGVELHAANGYLIDQFLQDSTNQRSDAYGGSIANRARLLLELTDVLCEVFGADRTGVHLAPQCDAHDMGDSDPEALFSYVAEQLNARKIAFLFAREDIDSAKPLGPVIRKKFQGVYIINQQLSQARAEQALQENLADAAAFGQLFIANPDLPQRFATGAALNPPDPETFYTGGAQGYTDYPALS